MSITSKYISVFILFFSMATHCPQLPHQDNQEPLTLTIAKAYIQSFPNEKINIVESITKEDNISNKLIPIQLKATTQRKIVLNTIFASANICNTLVQQSHILNHHAWKDLRLFYGPNSAPTHHLFTRINRTITVLGEGALATLLVTPTVDPKTLQSRQQVIKTLLQEKTILQDLKNSLKEYKKGEPSFLSFWTNGDPLYTQEYITYMKRRFLSKKEQINKSEKKLKPRILWSNLRGIYSNWLMHPLIGIISAETVFLASQVINFGKEKRNESYKALVPLSCPFSSIFYALSTDRFVPIMIAVMVNITAGWSYYNSFKTYKEYRNIFRNLASRMRDVQLFIQTAAQINKIIATTPALEKNYSMHLKSIRKLLNKQEDKHSEIVTLLNNLQSMTFTNWSYFKGKSSKLLATFQLFLAHKDIFLDAMYELGKLDAFIGMTTLIQEAAQYHSHHAYSFTEVLDRTQKQKPYIYIEDMWNPLLDAKKVVGNNIHMEEGKVRNMILTGPNAGGKSTFLSGIAISLLLSQTFGIIPAKSASITPFNKISTYISITSEIAMGKSLFMIEVERAHDHLTMVKSLQEEEFSFAIFDEPLSRTNPADAMAAAYSILLHMAKFPNTINIIATHYDNIMDLEQNEPALGFQNYKVYIKKDKEKKINYTYKIIPGKANQSIALDILEEEGYDKKMVEQARDIVSQS